MPDKYYDMLALLNFLLVSWFFQKYRYKTRRLYCVYFWPEINLEFLIIQNQRSKKYFFESGIPPKSEKVWVPIGFFSLSLFVFSKSGLICRFSRRRLLSDCSQSKDANIFDIYQQDFSFTCSLIFTPSSFRYVFFTFP